MKRRDALKAAGMVAVAANAQQQPAARKRLLFDDHQFATVAALCDLIIPTTDTPGAKAARTHEFIDLLLKDGPLDRRNRFLAGLGWLDGYTIRQHKAPFVKLAPADQTAILKALDAAASADLKPGQDFFREMKSLTVMGYYTSREGIAELNKGGRVPSSFGCKERRA